MYLDFGCITAVAKRIEMEAKIQRKER